MKDIHHGVAALGMLVLSQASLAQTVPHYADPVTLGYATFDHRLEQVSFSTVESSAPLRKYVQSTTVSLRDPVPPFVRYEESANLPLVRSGSLPFDALFALAGAEMRQNAVAAISDGSYNGGEPIACECFATGEKWHYVWTRDLSYAAHLGLALLDPQRVRNSLAFKLSGYRSSVAKPLAAGGSSDGLQIIQDTGSGGSWPVSTDRVSWAFGAAAVLVTLPAAERRDFAAQAYKALRNTLENDRLAAFDANDGLYRGEQSFLDWREQSYAAWIVDDLASLATSKSLSTNVAHYQALTLTAELAQEQGQSLEAQRYQAWAAKLKLAINARFWLPDAGLYSSITAGHFDGAPLYKFDWLGLSLAILTGVADAAQTDSILANYPHGPFGAPVIFPQQPGVPVYHNRALWPFVTAYGLKAAVKGRNVSVADRAYDSLMRGAALNLSNMENLEWLSGQALLQDERHPELNGPVINSQRQLWSVGGYLGMVIENVFGVHADARGLSLAPFITGKLRREAFGKTSRISLQNLRLRDSRVQVVIHLPPLSRANGVYTVRRIALNGKPVAADIAWDQLPAEASIEIFLGPMEAGRQALRLVDADPYAPASKVFAPVEAGLRHLGYEGGRVVLEIIDGGNAATRTRYRLFRNGVEVANDLAAGRWLGEPGSAVHNAAQDVARDTESTPACYAVQAQHIDTGHRSHHSAPLCLSAALQIPVTDPRVVASRLPSPPDARHDTPYLKNWGAPEESLSVTGIAVARAGLVHLQVAYRNTHNAINLGITNGVKWMSLLDSSDRIVAQGVISLPHAKGMAYSTPLSARLAPGVYRLQLQDFFNMSYLQSNAGFSSAGGRGGAVNQVDILGFRLLGTD